jgi:glucokinase
VSAKISIGYDLGGTSCGIGLFDIESGLLRASSVYKVDSELPGKEIFDGICAATEKLLEENGVDKSDIGSVCFATAGTLGPKGAKDPAQIEHILISPNIPGMNGFPLKDEYLKRFPGVLFLVENDANAAGWAEWFYGTGRDERVRTLIGFTLGTGLGGYVIVDGNMIRPAELGHVVVETDPSAFTCGCGSRGCAEAYVSIGGMKRIARGVMMEAPESKLWEIPPDKLDPLPIANLAREGDRGALLVYAKVGYYLGKLIWNLKRVCEPDAVVFSGNISRSLDLMLPAMQAVLNEDPLIESQPIIKATELGPDKAGIMGAAGLAIKYYKGSFEKT